MGIVPNYDRCWALHFCPIPILGKGALSKPPGVAVVREECGVLRGVHCADEVYLWKCATYIDVCKWEMSSGETYALNTPTCTIPSHRLTETTPNPHAHQPHHLNDLLASRDCRTGS